jgi:small conductance mechanosensitive channel
VTQATLPFTDRIVASFSAVAGGIADRMPAILAAAVVLVIAWLAGRIVFAVTRRVLARRSTAAHVDVLVARFARGIVLALGVVVALGVLGVDLTALVASLGLAGLTLGFALRDVLANSVSGVMLLLQRPFTVGDAISVAGQDGVVEDVRVRDTVLRTSDGRIAFIPNTTVFNDVVVNSSAAPVRRFEMTVSTADGADALVACASARDAIAATAGVLKDPAPGAAVASVGARRACVVAHGWVDTRTTGLDATRSAALAAVQAALRVEEGLD